MSHQPVEDHEHCRRGQSLLVFLVLLIAQPPAIAGDWPQYGGPNRDGIADEKGLLPAWPLDGPPLLWKRTDLGAGYSPLSVVGTRAYTLAYRDQDEFVVALDRGNGKEIWSTSLGVARESHAMAFLRQRQPLVVDDRLYAFSTQGHLVCLDVDQGKELWRKRYLEDFQGRYSPFGWTDYPLVDGDRLICTPGGKDTFHVALSKSTGEVIWKSAAAEGLYPSHSPMVVATVDGLRHYVQNLGGGLVGISAKDGKLLWRYEKVSNRTANMATPVVQGDLVFAASGYNTGCAQLQLVRRGNDLVEAKELYHDRKFQSMYGNMISFGEHIYAGNGPTFGMAYPACYDRKAGKIVWQRREQGRGAPATVAAPGRLYFRFADGLMVLAEATPEGFKEKGRFSPPHRSKWPAWSVPVIAHGRLFLRDQNSLLCYDLRADRPRETPKDNPKGDDKPRQPDAVFVPSPREVVETMLDLAKVSKNDIVYDLGSGDGRIVITAAMKYQAKGVGIELDPVLVRQARELIRKGAIENRVTIKQCDLFAADFADATVITLYLLPHLNVKLLPKLNELRPGVRIVSHAFAIEGIQPEKVVRFLSEDRLTEHTVYLYLTPLRPKKLKRGADASAAASW
jgi:outer membrane protein assembly factor BamB